MQNSLVRSRGNTLDLVTCALRIETKENPKLSLLILWCGYESEMGGEWEADRKLHKSDSLYFITQASKALPVLKLGNLAVYES